MRHHRSDSIFLPPTEPPCPEEQTRLLVRGIYYFSLVCIILGIVFEIRILLLVPIATPSIALFWRTDWQNHIRFLRRSAIINLGIAAFWTAFQAFDIFYLIFPEPEPNALKPYFFESLLVVWALWACAIWSGVRLLRGYHFAFRERPHPKPKTWLV